MKDEINSKKILDKFKINIISWYDFEKNTSLLLFGNIDKTIIKFLCEKFEKVIYVTENEELSQILSEYKNLDFLNKLNFNMKFDYILIMNYFKNDIDEKIINFINEISKYVKDDGKILSVFKNKLGAKEIAKSSFEGFSINRIKNIFQETDFKYNKFYYVLPNEKYTNIIFSNDYLPTESDMRRNLDFSETLTNLGTIENDILIKNLKDYKKDFKILANFFFVEFSKVEFNNDIRAVFYSNIRNEKYQIRTKILTDVAIKEAIYDSGAHHINIIKYNIDILRKCKIKTLDSYDNNKIISKLAINSKNLDNEFLNLYKNKDANYKKIIDKFKNDILLRLEITDNKNNIFEKLNINTKKYNLEKLTFIKYGLWDLTLQNTFLIDNELYVYDQEWYEENVPMEFILYRTFLHGFKILSENEKDELYKEFNIYEFKDLFLELEKELQKDITNKELNLLYSNTMYLSSEEILKNEKNELLEEKKQLLKKITEKNEIINSEKLLNHNLQSSYNELTNQKNNLEIELKLREDKINELQLSIQNSKALKITRKIREVISKITRKENK